MRGAKAYTTSRNIPGHLERNPQDISPKEAERAYHRYVIERASVSVPDMVVKASKAYNEGGMTKYTITVKVMDKQGVTVERFEVPFIRLSKNKVKVVTEGDYNELRIG